MLEAKELAILHYIYGIAYDKLTEVQRDYIAKVLEKLRVENCIKER